MLFGTDIVSILLSLPAVLIALTVHEYCHGYVAYRLGDPTARSLGRLTLNPLKHLDPIGTLLMVFCGFGYARPVPINPRYFKKPRNGMALVAIAGPISNFILAFLSAILSQCTLLLGATVLGFFPSELLSNFIAVLSLFFYVFHFINLCYFVFNLIPIPPLDGSRVLYLFLPARLHNKLIQYERVFFIIFMIALFFGAFTGVTSRFVNMISEGMYWLINLIIPI